MRQVLKKYYVLTNVLLQIGLVLLGIFELTSADNTNNECKHLVSFIVAAGVLNLLSPILSCFGLAIIYNGQKDSDFAFIYLGSIIQLVITITGMVFFFDLQYNHNCRIYLEDNAPHILHFVFTECLMFFIHIGLWISYCIAIMLCGRRDEA